MRKLLSVVIAFAVIILAPKFVSAADTGNGAQIFSSTCAACHMGGGNVVNGDRTLQKADLEAYLSNYSSDHESAIAAQIRAGKNAMPSFSDALSTSEIDDVAAYVESMANQGWS